MKKFTTLLICFILWSVVGLAQTSNDLAEEAYKIAETAYSSQKYDECISNCKSVIELKASTDTRIQYLMSKAFFQLQDYVQAKVQIQKYFDLDPPVSDNYLEMTSLRNQVDKYLTEQKEQEELAREQQRLSLLDMEAWGVASAEDTKEAYENYRKAYPIGIRNKEAKDKLDEIFWKESSIKNTIESYKQYLISYPEGLYASSAKNKIKAFQDDISYQKYMKLGDESTNTRSWEVAISNYETALSIKPNDSEAKDKLRLAKAELEKQKLILDYKNSYGEHERARKALNRRVVRSSVWTGIFVGAAFASYAFIPDDNNAEIAATFCGIASLFSIGSIGLRAIQASEERKKMNFYQKKIQEFTFVPIINPFNRYYGCGIVMKIN
jgi:tetratricopeptide (TPR) repeat protein